MSLQDLFLTLKHLPGQHSQQSHAGHSSRNFRSPLDLDFVKNYNSIISERGMNLPVLDDDLIHFSKIKPGVKATGKRKGNFGLCALNSMENCQTDEALDVAVGVIFDKENIEEIKNFDPEKLWHMGAPQNPSVHVWNLDKEGRVIDTSLGSNYGRGGAYIGVIVPKDKLTNMNDDSELLKYAWDVIQAKYPKPTEDELDKAYNDFKKNRGWSW